ncbi:MAG: hypothetical protein FJ291_10795 [Planctomycetes bacterium]|nr:hypothetical protein [Planctomycetota bacterium]
MNGKRAVRAGCLLAALALGFSHASAATKAGPAAPLTKAGEELLAKHSAMLTALQAEIAKAVPVVDEQKKSAYLKAREAEKAAEAGVNAAQAALDKVATAKALVDHAKGKWIGGAEKGIAEAEAALKKATTEAEREAARKELAKWQANKEDGIKALKERQGALDKATSDEPKLTQALKAAQEALAKAHAHTLKAASELNLERFLASDKLDAQLVKYIVLAQATPRGLAEFAQQGKEPEALVEKLLADNGLMKQMLVADGAKEGKYGRAMEIYTAIQKASPKAGESPFQRLALAISLEHAVPVAQSNPKAQTDAPATVDPVKRYLHFEKASLDGELDPCFKDLTVWEYRNAVNGDEPDSILAWGRQMLRNYRPDHIYTADYNWRYVEAVRTEVAYGSQDVKNDLPTLQNYQNIIMNGGVCGRRAFFGRFILRSFGIPTIARPQPGHASLAHWTPAGWVICLGGGWGAGWTAYGKDLDFLASAQARKVENAYPQVQRAQWVGDALGEKRAYGFHSDVSGFWNSVALYRQRAIIEEAKAVALAAVGTDIGEANESKVKEVVKAAAVSEADKKIVVGQDGVITIPAVACSKPTNSTGKIRFMKSYLGGMQLHYSRMGGAEEFEYTFEAPTAGKYALSARVVTTSADQHLLVATNDAKAPADIAVPFTVGRWDKTPPVEVSLVKGKNVLRFSRTEPVKGLTIKDFTLTPVK